MTHTNLLTLYDILNSPMENLFQISQKEHVEPYPPYNIVKTEDGTFYVLIALAGWPKENIEVTQEERTLKITGTKDSEDSKTTYIHRGISNRNFTKTFSLSKGAEVVDVSFDNGMLQIEIDETDTIEKKHFDIS